MPRSTNKASKAKRTGKCHVCGNSGHYAHDCKEKKSDSEELVLQDTTGKCHVCGETGHYARECKDKKSNTSKVVLKEVIASGTQSKEKAQGWYLNYGSSVHVCCYKSTFVDYNPMNDHEVILPNNDHVDVAGIGTVTIQLDTNKALTLSDVLHIPKISKCYVSVARLDDCGYSVSFVDGVGLIMKSHESIGLGLNVGDGVYRLSLMGDRPARKMITNAKANGSGQSMTFGGGQCVIKQGDVVIRKGYNNGVLYTMDMMKEQPALAKVVHPEKIGLCGNEHPELTKARARGWYVLPKCTMLVCNSRDMFDDCKPVTGHEVVPEGDSCDAVVGYGTVKLQLTTGKVLTLKNVSHMPKISKCCIPFKTLKEMGFSLGFDAEEWYLKKGDEIVGSGSVEDGLLRLGVIDERSQA